MIEEIKDHQFSETDRSRRCVSQSIVVISAKVNKLGSSIE
jgi:hypothetical protein